MTERVGRGWGTVAGLALAVVALSVVHPLLLIAVPLAVFLVALPPRRPVLVGGAVALAVVAFTGAGSDPLWYVERGWVLLLGAWFVVMVVLQPKANFLSRALGALGSAVLTTGGIMLLNADGGWRRIEWLVTRRMRGAAADVGAMWSGLGGADVRSSLSGAIRQALELQMLLFPALVALASLAGLGVAWWAYRRLADGEARPLAPLREFRFRDELVWLLIGGITLMIAPIGEWTPWVGSNVLLFMGALYALRGAGVLLAVTGSLGIGGIIAAAVAVLLLYPLVMIGTVLVGLSDTWLDIRSRRRSAAGSGR